MAENPYVLRGAIAGVAAGIVATILYYADMPTVGEVLNATETLPDQLRPATVNETLLAVTLRLAGIAIILFYLVAGTLFGWLYEKLAAKTSSINAALLAGGTMIAAFNLPDLAIAGSIDPASLYPTIAYTLALAGLDAVGVGGAEG